MSKIAEAAVSGVVELPSRIARIAALGDLLGRPDPSVRQLALGIRATTHRHFALHVLPLVRAHWPALFGDPFYAKLRIGACDLYASAPYMALFCARDRPLAVRLITDVANRLPLPLPALALLGRGAMGLLGRFALADEHRRIVLIASFIVIVDHVFDHGMHQPPAERARTLIAVLDGRQAPTSPALRLLRALAVAMAERLAVDERRAFDAAMARVKEWIGAEVRAMKGEIDPRGQGHRLAGVEGTIDGLLFPVVRYTGEDARAWMYEVSRFVQIADDWLDCEDDVRSGRPTPVLSGAWGFAELASSWRATCDGIEALVRSAGLGSPHYGRFVREAYKLMMIEVIDAMIARPNQ